LPHRRIAASPHRRIAASPHRRIAAALGALGAEARNAAAIQSDH
jgi:hypothetical protein